MISGSGFADSISIDGMLEAAGKDIRRSGRTGGPCAPTLPQWQQSLTYWRPSLLRWTWIRVWGVGYSLRNLVFVEGVMPLRDHFLPHTSFHRSWSRLPGEIRSHLPLPELRSSNVPFPILPEKYRTACPSKRCSAQSYSICAFADKYETSPLVCLVLKSNSTSIFARSPSRRIVAGSAYTVVPESLAPSDIHSAYAGPLLNTRSVIRSSRFT